MWFGDTWRMNNQFTVNYGVRWDADSGALDPPHVTTQVTFDPRGGNPYSDIDIAAGDQLYPGGLRDINNVAPRAGFTWNIGGEGKLVIRGGSGLYFSINDSNTTFSQQSFNGERILVNSFPNDGLPGFIAGSDARPHDEDFVSGRFPLPAQSPRVIAHDYQACRTRGRASSACRRKSSPGLGFEADLTHWKGYNFGNQRDPNLFFNPATGYNVNPASGRPGCEVRQDPVAGLRRARRLRRDLDGAQPPVPQQLAGRHQLHADAVHERRHDQLPVRGQQPLRSAGGVGALARSSSGTRSASNGIWRLPYDFSVAGAYLYGSGNYYQTTYAASPFGAVGTNRYVTAPLDGEPGRARSLRRRSDLRGRPGHPAQRAARASRCTASIFASRRI